MSRRCCNVAALCKAAVLGLLDLLKKGTAGELKEYENSLVKMSVYLSEKFSPAGMSVLLV